MSTTAGYETATPTESEPRSSNRPGKPKIAFFGVFGIQNLGNECTLQAILHHARKRLPGAEMFVVAFDAADASRRHRLPAVAVTQQNFAGVVRRGGLAKVFRLLRRIPRELNDWVQAVKSLRGADLMVMTGTGMLTDYMTTATGFPYVIFMWAIAARIARCKVRFVGVGVGPIYGRLSRIFIRTALSLADYRGYRDQNSKNRIRKSGFNSDGDPVFPDLVFSLPPEAFPHRPIGGRGVQQVGLGVMDHRDIHMWTREEHDAQYNGYLEKMCEFIVWLTERGYSVRILQGDAKHDSKTRAELRARLEKRGIDYQTARIVDEGSATVEELIAQIARVDLVVSPRFHNLLLGLMMNIPAVSISYDPKNDSLLESVGLGKYCQPIENLDLQRLIDHFSELAACSGELMPDVAKKAKAFRNMLDEQYDRIFGEFATSGEGQQ